MGQGEFADSPREEKFFSNKGGYRWDDGVSDTMKKSLMYKLVYYRYRIIGICKCRIYNSNCHAYSRPVSSVG